MAEKKRRHVYLISDSTGETVRSIAKACAVQFENIEVVEHLWPMVRSRRALETALDERNGWILFVDVEPKFDRLRESPRLAAIAEAIGLRGGNEAPSRMPA